jgi:beta-phosphoglucomutase-like phosphatase (HAD superfamily)
MNSINEACPSAWPRVAVIKKRRTTSGTTALLSQFENELSSTTEVANAKPAPMYFCWRRRRPGVAPSRCYVVEDTATGVVAGVAAGMTFFRYCALTPAHRHIEAGAHYTISEMSKLPRIWFEGRLPAAARGAWSLTGAARSFPRGDLPTPERTEAAAGRKE